MSFALNQPYFFPYQGYFSLIDSVDHFMFFDDAQYVRKSWMGRNRFLNNDTGEPFYFRPGIIKPQYGAVLTEVKLDYKSKWKEKILEQTATYKNTARYYEQTLKLIEEVLSKDYESLLDLNINSINCTCKMLGIDTRIDKYSDYKFWFDEKPTRSTWGLKVTEEIKETTYINLPGGESFIKPDGFSKSNIKLGFIQPVLEEYQQSKYKFVPGLSILDTLFFNGVQKTRSMVQNYKIKWVN